MWGTATNTITQQQGLRQIFGPVARIVLPLPPQQNYANTQADYSKSTNHADDNMNIFVVG
jgi:hypothetical protein